MCTCGFRINVNLVKEGSFRINAKLVKEELNKDVFYFPPADKNNITHIRGLCVFNTDRPIAYKYN